VKTDKFILFVYCDFLVLLSTTVYSENINKQNMNIADETLTDYSFLRRYHYTKSKNYFKRRYRIRHWIPMFIGTPCILVFNICRNLNFLFLQIDKYQRRILCNPWIPHFTLRKHTEICASRNFSPLAPLPQLLSRWPDELFCTL